MVFTTTNWELVEDLSATGERERKVALKELSERNWKPVYAFLRGRGYSMSESDDLTQEFFCYLIEKELMNRATPEKGKFRSFLIGILIKFCSDQSNRARAKKRTPQRLISLDAIQQIERSTAPNFKGDPQKVFQRTWAQSLLERVMERLQHESESLGKKHLYDLVQKVYFETGQGKASYSELAERYEMTLDQIGNALRAAKQLYASLLRDEIAKTVDSREDVDDEIREIMLALQEKK